MTKKTAQFVKFKHLIATSYCSYLSYHLQLLLLTCQIQKQLEFASTLICICKYSFGEDYSHDCYDKYQSCVPSISSNQSRHCIPQATHFFFVIFKFLICFINQIGSIRTCSISDQTVNAYLTGFKQKQPAFQKRKIIRNT